MWRISKTWNFLYCSFVWFLQLFHHLIHKTLSLSVVGNGLQDGIPVTKRSVSSCRGQPDVMQCIRSYFFNRFKLMHRAVNDPVDLRNIGKRNQWDAPYLIQRPEDPQESREDRLNTLYDDLLKATSSETDDAGDKRAAVDFRGIGRRSYAADFRNIGKRYLGADFRNIGKRGSYAADFRQIGKRGYAADFRNIGKRLGVDFRNIGKRTVLNSENDTSMDLRLLSMLCSYSHSLAECSDSLASKTYIWRMSHDTIRKRKP